MKARTPDQLRARYEEGTGQGEGADYVPWLSVRDVPSKGVTSRVNGQKTGRIHVLFSHLERSAFVILQRRGDVDDLREQFPLWPLEDTLEIAQELGVKHPTPPGGGTMIMTTDILVTKGGNLEAYAVKPESDLRVERTLEKLDIERAYWGRRGVSWTLLTEKEMPSAVVRNLEWMNEHWDISPDMLDPEDVALCEGHLMQRLAANPDKPLNKVCLGSDVELGMPTGTSLVVVKHALARKHWLLPLERTISVDEPLERLPVVRVAPVV